MADISYRANITSKIFPMLSELQGQTVIIPAYDQAENDSAQIYYGHNIIPTVAGIESVGYSTITNAPSDTDGSFIEIILIRDPDENVGYFCNTVSGRCYVLLNSIGWVRTDDITNLQGYLVSSAHINGQTYIYFGGVGCYKYDFATNAMVSVTLTSLNPVDILGITSSSGYMIAWTDTAVAWSSTIDPTDFSPDLVTGAGGGAVQEIEGPITVCLPHTSGFIVYTKKNAVMMLYSGNPQFPFIAKEISGAGGVIDNTVVSYESQNSNQYAYTTSGLQEITIQQANTIAPEVTDYIAGSKFEDFNETTFQFNITYLSVPMKKKLTLISDRYLVLSYGTISLTHALVYDVSLKRWGKFKIDHVDCFEFSLISPDVIETPRRSIGFLQADGTVKVVVMSYDTTGSKGVIVLGKYQLDRNYYITLSQIWAENIRAGQVLTVRILSTLDGLNYTISEPTLSASANNFRKYKCRKDGINHSIVFIGGFHLSSIELKLRTAGKIP